MSDLARPLADDPPPSVDALRALCYAEPRFAERYEGWEVIGQGAFATVVRVSLMGQPVALKIFTNLKEEGKARFRSEFASTVRLTSPYVVRTYSAFENGPIAWLEMEAVDGSNLEDVLAQRERENNPLPLEEALDIAIAVSTVVAQAHELGIVHRDIKPANILLPRSGNPMAKLGDFGIARFMDAATLTATGAFPGTPKWAAPEVFALKPQVGAPADVYSLSLCLFALFTGNRYPWVLGDDASPGGFMAAHLRNRPLRMRFFERALSEDLESIVASGLEKRPLNRPTASTVLDALSTCRRRSVALAAPVETSAPSLGVRLRRLPRGAMITLAGALAIGILAWVLNPGRAAEDAWPPVVASIDPRAAPTSAPHGVVGEERHDVRTAELRVAARSGFVRVQNGDRHLSSVTIVLVGAQGRHHTFTLPGHLSSLETVDIAFDAFGPAATREEVLREARVTGESASGILDLQLPMKALR